MINEAVIIRDDNRSYYTAIALMIPYCAKAFGINILRIDISGHPLELQFNVLNDTNSIPFQDFLTVFKMLFKTHTLEPATLHTPTTLKIQRNGLTEDKVSQLKHYAKIFANRMALKLKINIEEVDGFCVIIEFKRSNMIVQRWREILLSLLNFNE